MPGKIRITENQALTQKKTPSSSNPKRIPKHSYRRNPLPKLTQKKNGNNTNTVYSRQMHRQWTTTRKKNNLCVTEKNKYININSPKKGN